MTKPLDIPSASVHELLAAYRQILAELRSREVIRTTNAPTGDYAEFLIATHTGGALAPNSEKSWDVLTPEGQRLQVKARVQTGSGQSGERQLSAIRSWDFDLLAVVLFEDDYSVHRGVLLPVDVALPHARFVTHVNGDRLIATDGLLGHAEAIDITEPLRVTAASL